MAKSKSRSPKSHKVTKRSKRSKSPKASKKTKRTKRSKASKSSSKGSPSKHIAWCVRCHDKVKMTGCKVTKSVKGQPMLKGKCSVCGTKVNRFVKKGTKSC
jgi:cytochrome c553